MDKIMLKLRGISQIHFRHNLVFGVLAVVAISIMMIFAFARSRSSKAAIHIKSLPGSIVYIDGEQVGKTPYDGEFSQQEIDVKLIPDSFSDSINPYEGKVSLFKNVKTIVNHEFNPDPEKQVTEIISFSKSGESASSISVVTVPDGARVKINGKSVGVSPIRLDDVLEGKHTIAIDSFSYHTRIFDVQARPGLLLTAFVDLSRKDNADKHIEAAPEKEMKEEIQLPESPFSYVVIKDTPTGFLRVRDRPGINGIEIGRATPGEEYDVISFDAENGWYEIDFESTASGELTQEGWVSARYASGSATLN